MKRILLTALFAIGVTPGVFAEPAEASPERFFGSLRKILKSTKKVARVYYHLDCSSETAGSGLVPRSRELPALSNVRDAVTVCRELFDADKGQVRGQGRRLVAIQLGRVDRSILDTKVKTLHLERIERYNADLVLSAILNAPEVKATIQSHSLEPTIEMGPGFVNASERGRPHMPAALDDRTVEELLDSVAETFNGIVCYGECGDAAGSRWFWFSFEPIESL